MRKNYNESCEFLQSEPLGKYYQRRTDRIVEKQNNLTRNNTQNSSRFKDDKNPYYHQKSTTSTIGTNIKGSTENLQAHRLQSQVLELQKTLDEQQFEIQTLSEEGNFYMNTCQSQKDTLMSMNIENMKSQYNEEIKELLKQRQKMQDILFQLKQDYGQAYEKQENELEKLKIYNQQYSKQIQTAMNRKKALLSLISNKSELEESLQREIHLAEERLDELRNVERKLKIAHRQIQRLSISKQ